MAIQPPHVKKPGMQILRTPAPDTVTDIRSSRGGSAYGQSGGHNPSSIAPGQGGPQSLLGQNMRQSVDDPAMDQVLAKGSAGRDDQIPSDSEDFQLRPISDRSYPLAHGMARQQNPDAVFGKARTLPEAQTDNEEGPVRKPA
jgi:hypothetical protein